MRLKAALIIMHVLIILQTYGQTDSLKARPSIGIAFHAGNLVKIHGEYPPNSTSTFAEASVLWKCFGRKNWQSVHGYPSAGFSLIHAQFGNQDVLGQAIGALPMLRFEKWFDRSFLSIRTGLGIAWFSKPYDALSNPENLVIGSSFANMTLFALEYNHRIGHRWVVHAGGSFMHCSGAHLTVPNIGANLPALTMGVSFIPKVIQPRLGNKNNGVTEKGLFAGVQFINGYHEFPGTIRPADGPLYIVYGFAVHAGKSFKAHRKFSFGFNAHYYTAYADYLNSQELINSNSISKKDPLNVICYAGYEWNFGRVAFFVQGGINLYDPVLRALNKVWDLPKHGWLHQYTANKIGYRIYAHSQFNHNHRIMQPFIHIAVKTNGGTADFLELGIGADFRSRKSPKHETD